MMRMRMCIAVLPLLVAIVCISPVKADAVVDGELPIGLQDAPVSNYTYGSSPTEYIPEPATLAILGFGSVLLSKYGRSRP